MRSHWIKVGPNPVTAALIKRGALDTETQRRHSLREEGHVMMEAETGAKDGQGQPRLASDHQELEEAREDPPQGFRGSMAL